MDEKKYAKIKSIMNYLKIYSSRGDLAQMVERSLSMREALGSMPRFSTFLGSSFEIPMLVNSYFRSVECLRFYVDSCSYSSVGQSVRLITVRSAVQARVGAFLVEYLGIGDFLLHLSLR